MQVFDATPCLCPCLPCVCMLYTYAECALIRNDFVREFYGLLVCRRYTEYQQNELTPFVRFFVCKLFVYISNFRHPSANDNLPNRFFVFIGLEIRELEESHSGAHTHTREQATLV